MKVALVLLLVLAATVVAAVPPCDPTVPCPHTCVNRPKTFPLHRLGIFSCGGWMVQGTFPPLGADENGCAPLNAPDVYRRIWSVDSIQTYNPPPTPEELAKLQDIQQRPPTKWSIQERQLYACYTEKVNKWANARRVFGTELAIGKSRYDIDTFTYRCRRPCEPNNILTVTETDFSQWPDVWDTTLIPITFTGTLHERGRPSVKGTICLNFTEYDETKVFCAFGTLTIDVGTFYLMSSAAYNRVRVRPPWWPWMVHGLEAQGVWCEPTPVPTPTPDPKGNNGVGSKGNNGVGNGEDPQPKGDPPINDGPGTGPGDPGNKGGAQK